MKERSNAGGSFSRRPAGIVRYYNRRNALLFMLPQLAWDATMEFQQLQRRLYGRGANHGLRRRNSEIWAPHHLLFTVAAAQQLSSFDSTAFGVGTDTSRCLLGVLLMRRRRSF